MNVRVVALATALATAACVDIKPFKGGNLNGTGARAYTEEMHLVGELDNAYKLEFAATGFHFPKALTVGNIQLLAPAPSSTCAEKEGVGVAFTPAARFATIDSPQLMRTRDEAIVSLPGPGVAKIELEWSGMLTKSGCVGDPEGRSTFTFFPDGRITRMDLGFMPTELSGEICDCNNGSNGIYEMTTYFGFDVAAITNTDKVSVGPNDGDLSFTTEPVCVEGASSRVGIGWRNGDRVKFFQRITATTVAATADMIHATAMGLSPSRPGDASTTLWIDPDKTKECPALEAQIAANIAGVRLLITDGGSANALELGHDGIYGGETPDLVRDPGYVPISSKIVVSPVQGIVVPAFALRLDLTQRPALSAVTAASGPLRYSVQQVPNTKQYVFWFPDGLSAEDAITIETDP